MTTSGSTVFTQSRDQIIRRAGRQIGAWAPDEVPDAAQEQDFNTALNAMVKEWQAEGLHVWKEAEASLFLVPGQTRYTLGPDTTDRVVREFGRLTLAAAAAYGANQIYAGVGATLIPIVSDFSSAFSIDFGTSYLVSPLQQIIAGQFAPTLNVSFTIAAGNVIGITQTDGSIFWTTIAAIGVGSLLTLARALPIGAAVGAPIIVYPAPAGEGLPVRPMRLLDVRRYDILSQQEVSINLMSRLDYRDMPNKFSLGVPNSVFYDPQLGDGILWVWCPITAANTILNFTYMRSIEDFLNSKDTPDFPDEWINALTWGLAAEMALEFGVPAQRMSMIQAKASGSKDTAFSFDREPESIFLGVNFGQSTR